MIWLVLIIAGFIVANLLLWALVYGGARRENRANDGEAPERERLT